ncbi:MAG TPA: glycosyltransferase [Acidobacteriaceae bacterium]
MKPNVLIFRADLLPPSETFIAAQAHALRRYSATFAGLRRAQAGLELDPEQCVTLTRTNTPADKLRRRFFLRTGIAPQFLRKTVRCRPALVHAHFAIDAAIALPLQKHLGVPLIVTLHGYDATSIPDALRRTAPGRTFLRRREDLFARAGLFLCVSEHIRAQAIAHGFPSAKLRTLPIGIDLNLFAPDPLRSPQRDPIILFVGRLVEKKGCAHLLRAMALIEQRHPTARLLILGDGPLLEPLRLQARASLQRCTFLGPQPPAIVRDLMHRATVLAAPSIVAADGDTEGLPIVLCEAQAIGLPIVAFRGPGVDEAVRDQKTALLAPPADHHDLADCLSAILTDSALAARLAAAGRRRAEQYFSLATQTALLEDLYDEVQHARVPVPECPVLEYPVLQ